MKTNPKIICDYVSKIIVVGDSGVGKTNILTRFGRNDFIQNSSSTIGVEFFTKICEINGYNIKFNIWDTAGQEKYKSITRTFYYNSNSAIVVFDLNDKESFQNIKSWLDEIKLYTSEDIFIVLVGNKCDLEREVSTNQINKFVEENGNSLFI